MKNALKLFFFLMLFSDLTFAQDSLNTKNIFVPDLSVNYAGKTSGELMREEVLSNSILKLEGPKADIYRIESFRMSLYCGGADSIVWNCSENILDDRIYARNFKGCYLLFEYIKVIDEDGKKGMVAPMQFKIKN